MFTWCDFKPGLATVNQSDEMRFESGSAGLRPPKVIYFKAFRGAMCSYTSLAASGLLPEDKLLVSVLSGTVMGISCVATETLSVLLADAGLSWHTVPFHYFHLDCFSMLLPCHARRRAAFSPHTHTHTHRDLKCLVRLPK